MFTRWDKNTKLNATASKFVRSMSVMCAKMNPGLEPALYWPIHEQIKKSQSLSKERPQNPSERQTAESRMKTIFGGFKVKKGFENSES